jgi:hypothetical protein
MHDVLLLVMAPVRNFAWSSLVQLCYSLATATHPHRPAGKATPLTVHDRIRRTEVAPGPTCSETEPHNERQMASQTSDCNRINYCIIRSSKIIYF